MGMGNDGIEVSNSLDSYTEVNNSGIRDVNSQKSIHAMQNGSAMGNITSTGIIDPTISGTAETCPDSRSDTSDINNAPLSSTEEHNDNNYSVPFTDELLSETSGEISEKNEARNTLSQNQTPLSQNKNATEGNKIVVVVEENANGKPSSDVNSEITPQAELTPTPVYRNESLLRVSYLKRDWGGKRVSDIRSVSDLLETFYSLEEPIIMPLSRQREYYDQWARTPRVDVIQRLYPRAGSSMSTKCWALFQTIQSDQSKSNSNTPLAPPQQRLVPPSNSEVMCDSLDSIIEHYNQFLSAPPAEVNPNTPVRSTGQPRVTAPQIRANSGSSRSSSCGSNRGNIGSNNGQKHDGTASKGSVLKSKKSQVPCGGRVKNTAHVTDSVLSSQATESVQSYCHRAKKSHFPDYELCSNTASDSMLSNVEMFDISTSEQVNKITSKSHSLRRTIEVENSHSQKGSTSPSSIQGRINRLAPMSANENRDTIAKIQPDSMTYLGTPSPSQGQNGSVKDDEGNVYGINTSTLSLTLPYERAHTTVAEVDAPPTKNPRPKSKPSSPHEDVNADKKKPAEMHERFPLRSTAFISRSKRANTTIDFSHNRTRLKNLTRPVPARSHNVHDLNDSLHIHEIPCEADKNDDQQKWEHPLKRRACPNQRTQPFKHECRPAVQLPVRMHSMLEHHLSPTTSTVSPEEQKTPSRRHSAVSLASVHFLDLADLKNLLKRSNTTIHHL